MVDINNLKKFYYALSDEVRLKILKLLYENKKMCVCEIQSFLGISQPNLSFHLKILREANIVKTEKKGKWTYYSLNYENTFLKANLKFIKSLKVEEKFEGEACPVKC